jgi:response regulator RpfG family c-di-GMP phosphodiesterase
MKNKRTEGILIIDDDEYTRICYRKLLESSGYVKIYEAKSITESISVLTEFDDEIYVVLLDLMLPDGFGLDVMEHLLNIHSYIVGIIVITGYATTESTLLFFRRGTENIIAADYLSKPTDNKALIERVERTINLIQKKRAQQSIFIQQKSLSKIEEIENQIETINGKLSILDKVDEISNKINLLEKKSPSFLKDLGMDLLRLLIIGLAVIAFLYLGIEDMIRRILIGIK